MTDPIAVLVVDDSALMRNMLKKMISSDGELNVVGTAMNGRFATQKIPMLMPEVIVTDLEMPDMNGIDFLKWRQEEEVDIPVIVLSAHAKEGASITMEALALGASDFITKPQGTGGDELRELGAHLINLLKAYGHNYRRKTGWSLPPAPSRPKEPVRTFQQKPDSGYSPFVKDHMSQVEGKEGVLDMSGHRGVPELIALGISTGGPNALRQVFAQISPRLPLPIVVVQHMPAGFTKEFANSLNKISPLEVKEAQTGDLVKPGRILIAPGDKHVEVEKRKLATVINLSDAPPQNGHKPSAGVLFESVARNFGENCIAVIMTGMGKDGAVEIGEIFRQGGMTLAQDEASSVVFGMPRVAIEKKHIREVVSLDNMARRLNELTGC
ncbi:MAG: chemotaxis-specific protein-glutamate methyltransferase CheB [Spirochaetales bacterium]|nr:chemotaxis-specific protein-glutamate methyltransferase CheB [Spirochaetales bacterium]